MWISTFAAPWSVSTNDRDTSHTVCIPFVQVGEGSVQCNGDCFVRRSVRVVGELERVECVSGGRR